jgi:hypothetical protein
MDAFQNARFIPLTGTQERGLSSAEAAAGRFASAARSMTPGASLGQAGETLRATAGGEFLSPETNPELGATVDAATGQIIDDFQRNVMPQLGSQAQAAGAFGGARHGLAEARAADEVTENIGETASRMLAQAYESERARQQQAARFLPQLAQAERRFALTPSQILQGVGETRRTVEQQEEIFPQQQAMQQAEFLQALNPGGTTTTTQRGARASRPVRFMRGGLGGLQLYRTAQEAFADPDGGGGGGTPVMGNIPAYLR